MPLESLLGVLPRVRAGRTGVRAWSILSVAFRRASLGVKDREAGNPHAPQTVAEGLGVTYRLIWDDGLVSRGVFERREIDAAPEEALAGARESAYDDPDAARVAGPAAMPDVTLHDGEAARAASGDPTALAPRLELVRRAFAEGGFATWSGSFSAVEARSRIVTSAGLDEHAHATLVAWHATFDGELGAGFAARAPDDEPAMRARLARLAALTARLQRPSPVTREGVLPVVLHPSVVEEYVIGTLLDNLAGSSVAHGDGAFRPEQFGDGAPVIREDLGLRLDPLRPWAAGSYRFTGEGIPAAPCSFIEGGRLVTPALDLKYAARLGRPPTPLPHALDTIDLVGPPRRPFEETLDGIGRGLLVLNVLGVHTQDASSGDFSLSAPQALAIENGALAGRVRATISGNLFEILGRSDLDFVAFEGEHTPGLVVSCRVDPRAHP